VNYIVFCSAAQPGKAGLDIRDALDQVALPLFPAKISFAVVVSVTADRPGRRYEFARFDEFGKVDFAQGSSALSMKRRAPHLRDRVG